MQALQPTGRRHTTLFVVVLLTTTTFEAESPAVTNGTSTIGHRLNRLSKLESARRGVSVENALTLDQ